MLYETMMNVPMNINAYSNQNIVDTINLLPTVSAGHISYNN